MIFFPKRLRGTQLRHSVMAISYGTQLWHSVVLLSYGTQLRQLLTLLKGLVTPRDHGFFSSKNHVIEEILKFFFGNIYYFE